MQHITPIGKMRNACTNLIGNSEGKSCLGYLNLNGRLIKINLKAIGCNGLEWIYLVEDTNEWRFVVNGYELWISIKCG